MLKINFPKNKYKTIYADPPWPEQGGGKIKRGADRHYPLMPVKENYSLVNCMTAGMCGVMR